MSAHSSLKRKTQVWKNSRGPAPRQAVVLANKAARRSARRQVATAFIRTHGLKAWLEKERAGLIAMGERLRAERAAATKLRRRVDEDFYDQPVRRQPFLQPRHRAFSFSGPIDRGW